MTDEQLLLAISSTVKSAVKEEVEKSVKEEVGKAVKEEVGKAVKEEVGAIKVSWKDELMIDMSMMMDAKLKPIDERTQRIELKLENDVMPRLRNIEECYTSTYDRYKNEISKMDAMYMDVNNLKKVVGRHSEILERIS